MFVFKKIIDTYKGFDKTTYMILKNGFKFCFGLCLLSCLILLKYTLFFAMPIYFYIGLKLFKMSLIFGIEFIVCSFVVDGVKKEMRD